MIEINLLPEEMRKKPAPKLALPEIPAAKVLKYGFIAFIVTQLLLASYSVYQRFEVARLRKDFTALSQKTSDLIKIKAETESMKTQLKDIRTLTDRKFYWALLLNSLSDSVYRGVWLKSFSVREGQESFLAKSMPSGKRSSGSKPVSGTAQATRYLKVEGSVVGQGAEPAAIGKFITQLKENQVFSDIFADVELATINQKKIKDIDVYDFVLICIFKNDKWVAV